MGDLYQIQCYKHNKKIHRAWDEAVLLEIHDDYLIFGNEKTKVTESDGRTWRTKEPAVLFFFKDNWYNIIGQYKKDGIYYYCNIASPFIIEDNTIKYIDYDYSPTQLFQYFQAFGFNIFTYYIIILFCIFNII